MNSLRPDTKVARSDDVLASAFDNEMVMMVIESGKYFNLNPTGKRIWEIIETPRTVSEICAVIEDEFDVDLAVCKGKIMEFIIELMDKEVVKILPS